MPLFFFHVRGDVSRPDLDGVDLNDAEEAWAEALQFATDLQNEPGDAFDGQLWSVVVHDSAGEFVFQLDFDSTSEAR